MDAKSVPKRGMLNERPSLVSKQCLECFCTSTNHTKSILNGPPEVIQFVNDSFHRSGIGEKQEMSRAFHISVFSDVELPNSINLSGIENEVGRRRIPRLTRRCRATSAGGKYGARGDFNLNAAARVEKYRMTFPTISRLSLFTGRINSLRTVYST